MAEPETILQLGIEAAREGNREEARNLFSLLTRQEPDNVQAWLWLAGVAEGPEQRRAALERVILLDPENEMAVKGLQAMGAPLPSRESERPTDVGMVTPIATPIEPEAPVATAASATPAAPMSDEERYAAELDAAFDDYDALPRVEAPVRAEPSAEEGAPTRLPPMPPRSSPVMPRASADDEEEPERRGPSTLLWVLIGLIAVILIVFLAMQLFSPGPTPTPTPTEIAAATAEPGAEPTTTGAEPTTAGAEPTPAEGGEVITPTTDLEPTATAPLTPTTEQPTEPAAPVTPPEAAQPAPVAIGTNLEADGWTYTYPNQNYALPLGRQAGGFTAQGTFLHVLVFVSNNSGTPQALPGNFFVLKDAQGRVYEARPDVSSATVQRGVNADLGHEDAIPANGLTTSVYLVFDVTPGATDLMLFARSNPDQGFPVIGLVP